MMRGEALFDSVAGRDDRGDHGEGRAAAYRVSACLNTSHVPDTHLNLLAPLGSSSSRLRLLAGVPMVVILIALDSLKEVKEDAGDLSSLAQKEDLTFG